MDAASGGTLEAPGPGTWLLDSVHISRPFTRWQSAIHAPNFKAGFRDTTRRYGLVIDCLDWRPLQGFPYFAVPPAPPEEIPARFAAAEALWRDKTWLVDLERWEREVKPASIAMHQSLQAVDLGGLDDAALLAHFDRCRVHQEKMVRQHHHFNGAAFLPMGDFMFQVSEWTGLPPSAFMHILRGAAPESAGSFPALDRLTAAIVAKPAARALLDAHDDPAKVVAQLQAMPGEVGAAFKAYLDIVGHRLLDSFDPIDPRLIDEPAVLLEGIRLAVDEGPPAASATRAEEIAAIRDRVPADQRAAFDTLLAETRAISHLRDERGLYSDIWAGGIMRGVLLEAGRRLAEAGKLYEPAHLIDGDPDEVRTLMTGSGGPDAAELEQRALEREGKRSADMPPFLGDPPGPPPPLDGLPPAVQRAMRAMGIAIDALFQGATTASEPGRVRGIAASPGKVTGTARLIDGPHEFDRIRRGDILVTPTTTEAFNVVLPLLSGIVTNLGGLLSHAAIVAREYGIPGVVGCGNATGLIADGTTVEVDGETGEVRVKG